MEEAPELDCKRAFCWGVVFGFPLGEPESRGVKLEVIKGREAMGRGVAAVSARQLEATGERCGMLPRVGAGIIG